MGSVGQREPPPASLFALRRVATRAAAQQRQEAWWPFALFLIVCPGILMRATPVLSADFPLNDGGLFSTMVRQIQQSGYALPEFVVYNSTQIPFAYPPLAFYVAALLADLTRLPVEDVLRLLPLGVSILTIPAFLFFARPALPSRAAVLVAVGVFGVLPGSYVRLIVGGGLTRSFGFTFAILALSQAYILYTRRTGRAAALMALFSALTLLSHISLAWFLAFSIVALFFALGRNRSGATRSALAAAGAAAITAPWWITVLSRHGVSPFVAASQTGSLLSTAATEEVGAVPGPFLLAIALLAIAAMACLTALGDRRFFILGWLGLILFLDTRSFGWLVTLPLALATGYIVGEGLVPALKKRLGRPPGPPGDPGFRSVSSPADRLASWATITVVAASSVYVNVGLVEIAQRDLTPLSAEERSAMRWVAENMSPSSTVLVISGDGWATDRSSEWFPVLAARRSIATAQGQEWLAGGEFIRRVESHRRAQACATAGASCLEGWSRATGESFTHVYVAKRSDDCCRALRGSLPTDPNYLLVYEGPGATIVERRSDGHRAAAVP